MKQSKLRCMGHNSHTIARSNTCHNSENNICHPPSVMTSPIASSLYFSPPNHSHDFVSCALQKIPISCPQIHSGASKAGPPHHLSHVSSYSHSRRPSLNPSMHSPRSLKLSQPQSYEPYPGSRPAPLELHPYSSQASARGRGFETPMPSPSGYSIVSADGAPSLITDTGSESRSPRGAASPVDLTLAPLVGSREERRNSCTRYLPQSGFAVDDDDRSTYDSYRRPGSVHLPPITLAEHFL